MRKNIVGTIMSLSIALSMIVTGTMPAVAAVKTSGAKAEYDEAYYVTTDYYGNITDGSIVKSYTTNGQNKITDYGNYDQINNLSDNHEPVQKADCIEFTFPEGEVPKNFYYEGKTKKPYSELPWDISVTYKLNGVVKPAEQLAGEKGLVEIDIDMLVNKAASEYSRNNYTVETAALFNDDKITSLEAEGAQVQLIGNIRMVLFVGLPGEEQHLSIRVGSDDFEFDGVTFLMVPATLGQLSEISRLAENKEKIEKNYRKLSDHLNNTINSFEKMESNLSRTAADLKKVAEDTRKIAGTSAPVADELAEAKLMLGSSLDVIDPMTKELISIKYSLSDLEHIINNLKYDLKDAEKKIDYLTDIETDLGDAADKLREMKDMEIGIEDIETTSQTAYQLYGAYLISKKGIPELTFGDFIYGYSYFQAYPQYLAGVQETYIQKLMEQGYSREQAEDAISQDPLKTEIENMADSLADEKAKETVQEYVPQEDRIKHLYNLYSANQASPSDTSYDSMALINDMVVDLHENLQGSLDAPENLLISTKSLIGDVHDYHHLVKDLNELGTLTKEVVVDKGQYILNEIEELNYIIDNYRPSASVLAQNIIDTARILNSTAVDTGDLLEGLGNALQDAADDIDRDGDMRETKGDICESIEDLWHDYTGDKNNLLLIDADAVPVSLSGEKNSSPRSIQVVIRSQEIKKEAAEIDAVAELNKAAGNTNRKLTFGERIKKMFTDFFDVIKKIFVREEN